jgi:hypothetical protein
MKRLVFMLFALKIIMNKQILISILCLSFAISTAFAQTYSGGSGTEQNPYRISSKADMETLASAVNGGNNYSGKYFLLTQSLSGITTIIGTSSSRYFSGIFDGGGHILRINISTAAEYVGVFGYASDATIKNLGVSGFVDYWRYSDFYVDSFRLYVGGICGYASGCTISNCYNTGKISGSYTNFDPSTCYSGGICGYASDGAISNCYNKGIISISISYSLPSLSSPSNSYPFTADSSPTCYSGGICGYASGETISSCYNTEDISSSLSSSLPYGQNIFVIYSGGICGEASGSDISNCNNKGSISGFSSSLTSDYTAGRSATFCGGICGYGGTISNCYNTGIISASAPSSASTSASDSYSSYRYACDCYSGGICGFGHTISNCYNMGKISASAPTFSTAGGICGSGGDTISNCYNMGSISTSSSRSSSGSYASGASWSGGICGNGASDISNCYNMGNISASASPYPSSYCTSFSGGICGGHSGVSGTISNCYNTGNILASASSSASASTYSSISYSGGICGRGHSHLKIRNCIAINATVGGLTAGRILGDYGNIENCYALASMQVNGYTMSSQDANSKEGKDLSGVILSNKATCSHTETNVFLFTVNPVKWQRSSDNGNTWMDIPCTNIIYTETDPVAGHYIYRAQNEDSSYSSCIEITYCDAVPGTVNPTPLTGATKTVDESITFSLELEDDNYNYQWYKNNEAVSGATSNTYTIDPIKIAHGGIYKCRVWNGCNAVESKTSTLTVNKSPQVITFPEISAQTYGDAAITLPEKTDKGLTIAYQITNSNVATVSGNVLTLRNPGTCTVIASQAGNADYELAATVERQLVINKQEQTITFDAIPDKYCGDPPFYLPAVTDKGLKISYQAVDPNVATVSGNTVTICNAGTTDIIATQAGDPYRYEAAQVTQTLTVGKASQSIVWDNIEQKTYGEDDFYLPATSNKGLPILYNVLDETVATVSGNKVHIEGAGTTNITATQPGSDNYYAAASVTLPLTVNRAFQEITFNALPEKTYGDPAFSLQAVSNSSQPITYESAGTSVATVSGSTVTIHNAGAVYITASIAGNSNYYAATPVQRLLTVNKAAQTLELAVISDRTYGDAPFALSVQSSTDLSVVYRSSDPGKLFISDNMATVLSTGEFTVTAEQAGNGNYLPAFDSKTFRVSKANLIVAADNKTRVYGDENPPLTCTFDGFVNGDSHVDLQTLPTIVCEAEKTSPAGEYPVTVSDVADGNYTIIPQTGTLTVNKALVNVVVENKEREYGEANPQLTYQFDSFKNDDTMDDIDILPTVNTPAISTSPAGIYAVNAADAADNNYEFSYFPGELSITKALLSVEVDNQARIYGDANPVFTISYSGFKNSETNAVLTTTPVIQNHFDATTNAGTYDIRADGGVANNYYFGYIPGQLTINKAPLTITAENKTRARDEINPVFTLAYTSFKNSETESVLDLLPVITCSANADSPVGFYDIELQGGFDNNYELTLFNGRLEVTSPTRNLNPGSPDLTVYPIPAKNKLYIRSDVPVERIELYNQTGVCVLIERDVHESLNISFLPGGFYLARIYVNGIPQTRKVIIKD